MVYAYHNFWNMVPDKYYIIWKLYVSTFTVFQDLIRPAKIFDDHHKMKNDGQEQKHFNNTYTASVRHKTSCMCLVHDTACILFCTYVIWRESGMKQRPPLLNICLVFT